MQTISLIAAIDEDGGLGKNNQLLCHMPADLQYFKSQTLGKPIIMGRKTWESIGRPLPHRTNIVITRQTIDYPGIIIAHSVEKALEIAQDVPEVMIIGGGNIFEQAMPKANKLYITRIHHQFNADTFFPEPDWEEWHLISSTLREKDENNLYDMTFFIYERKN